MEITTDSSSQYPFRSDEGDDITEDDSDVWEDLPVTNLARRDERVPPPSSSRSSTVRRRKPGKITAIVQSNATRKAFQKQSRTSNGRDKSDPDSPLLSVDSEQIRGAVKAGATNSWEYTRDVLTIALRLLKKPLAFMVFLFILLLLLAKLASIFRVAFQPLCFIPGVSRSAMCRDPPIFSAEPLRAGYSKLMDVQSTTFDQLLDQSVGGGELSMEIKKAEMATSDLVILVKYSELKSKSLIAKSLEDFVNDAKKTSRGLQKLNAKIGTAVDGIIAVNDYALHTIGEHMNKPKSAISYIWPYYDDSKTKELVSRSFSEAMTVLSNHVERVVLEAQQSLINLDRLDEHLITLHEIIHRENSSAIADKEELLASLWTQLGRNKQKIRGLDGHLYLLQNLGDYRMRAKAHVIAALHTLESISEDMEELREQVSAPGLVGDTVPVEVHLNSIKSGLDRLTQKRHTAQIRGEEAMQSIIGDMQDSQS